MREGGDHLVNGLLGGIRDQRVDETARGPGDTAVIWVGRVDTLSVQCDLRPSAELSGQMAALADSGAPPE